MCSSDLVFASEDGGESWQTRNRGTRADYMPEGQTYPEFGQCVHCLVRAPGGGRLYQQNHCGMYRSDDGGRAWESIEEGLPSSFGFPAAAHPRDPDSLYLIPLNGDTKGRYMPDGKAAVWRTQDGGRTWQAKRQGLPPERFFTAGLLHDVGRLLLFKKLPYASTEAMIHARENFLPLFEAERILLEFDHTDVSKVLLAEWKFPEAMAQAINNHHDPMHAADPRSGAVLHLADIMANAVGIADGGMYAVPDLDPAAWDELAMEPSELHALMVSFDAQFEKTMAAFL